VKGLIAAGGNATRLEELTRVTNKHLLPVGRWPMVYYPLQLLQRAGVREVLIVTGQQHAGQFIDLLGNGRVETRAGEHLFDLDLAYKVQVEAGGIAQVVGMARAFAAGEQLVVCLGDNIFEYAQAEAIQRWDDGALVFVSEVPDPEACKKFVAGCFDKEFAYTPIGTVQPNRQQVQWELINIFRYTDDGRLIEEWVQTDTYDFLRKLGAVGS